MGDWEKHGGAVKESGTMTSLYSQVCKDVIHLVLFFIGVQYPVMCVLAPTGIDGADFFISWRLSGRFKKAESCFLYTGIENFCTDNVFTMSKKDDTFHEYVMDVLSDIPGITSRAMFSGYGIYKDGIIFAIIADGALYFKADTETEADFKEYGSGPFTYPMKNGKTTTLSYWLLPEEIMENRELLPEWVERAVAASKRAKRAKKTKKK